MTASPATPDGDHVPRISYAHAASCDFVPEVNLEVVIDGVTFAGNMPLETAKELRESLDNALASIAHFQGAS